MTAASEQSVDGVSSSCCQCGASLCVRKQVINLALGNTDRLKCLVCLAQEFDSSAIDVLNNTRGYVLGRACFLKEWQRYHNRNDCPEPLSCIPDVCFAVVYG